jgi:hypothetical protein
MARLPRMTGMRDHRLRAVVVFMPHNLPAGRGGALIENSGCGIEYINVALVGAAGLVPQAEGESYAGHTLPIRYPYATHTLHQAARMLTARGQRRQRGPGWSNNVGAGMGSRGQREGRVCGGGGRCGCCWTRGRGRGRAFRLCVWGWRALKLG